jgi:hypothetical protein
MRPRTIGHVTQKSPNKCPEDAVRTRVQIRSFAPSVLLLRRTSNGRKLQRRSGGQPFLRQEGQHLSRLIARTFERELAAALFNTVPPPPPCLKAAKCHHLAAFSLVNCSLTLQGRTTKAIDSQSKAGEHWGHLFPQKPNGGGFVPPKGSPTC